MQPYKFPNNLQKPIDKCAFLFYNKNRIEIYEIFLLSARSQKKGIGKTDTLTLSIFSSYTEKKYKRIDFKSSYEHIKAEYKL